MRSAALRNISEVSSGSHSGGSAEQCGNEADLSVSASRIGGIAGFVIDADIVLSFSTGNIVLNSTSATYAGGIAGYISTDSAAANIGRCYNTGAISGSTGSSSYIAGIAGYNGSTAYMAAIYECYSTTTPSYTQGSGDTEVKGNGILSRSLSNGSQAVQNSYASDPGTNDTSQGVGTLDENSDLGFSYIYGGETPQLAWRTDSGNVSLNYQESTLYELNSNSTGGVNYRDSLRNVSSADALELMKAALEKDYSDYYDELIRTGVSGY